MEDQTRHTQVMEEEEEKKEEDEREEGGKGGQGIKGRRGNRNRLLTALERESTRRLQWGSGWIDLAT